MNLPIRLLAGAGAARRIAQAGLHASDIAAVPAAAGGPKGLALLGLDRFLFGHWLPGAPRQRSLLGASIGAWRMAAAASADPVRALARLEHAYLVLQRYPRKPSPALVSQVCREMLSELIGGDAREFSRTLNPDMGLHVVTARAQAPRHRARNTFFRAALANAVSRERLAAHLQRVVFTSGSAAGARKPCPAVPQQPFQTQHIVLTPDNLEDALLASASIPLIAEPVSAISGAPNGEYWDGGLIDYHLYWPYHVLDGLVLMPHFVAHVTAGWLDKFLPWRRHGVGRAGRDWLDNVLIVAPSAHLLARLPGGKLPDRSDFQRYGTDHDRRIRDWRRAIAECERIADAFAEFVANPGRYRLEPLG